ncbi:hypothetical protein P8452_76222 [Trifolium repens]|nr:hypothetical protein P8452_76222 [Trifolium repens]
MLIQGKYIGLNSKLTPSAVQKKFTANPKPAEDIQISNEKDNEEKVHKKKDADVNSKKKQSHTLTFVLTARSKAACGLTLMLVMLTMNLLLLNILKTFTSCL